MKHLTGIILIITLLSGTLHAQQQHVGSNLRSLSKRADLQYEHFAYSEAIQLYTRLYERDSTDTHAIGRLADSYRKLNEPGKAVHWYALLDSLQADSMSTEAVLHYAQTLSQLQQYDKAHDWYARYDQAVASDSRAAKKMQTISNLHLLLRDSTLIEVNTIPINSVEADFSPVLLGDQLIFVSARPAKRLVKHDYNWHEKSYLDLYTVTYNQDDNTWSAISPFHKEVNTRFHEGPLVFLDKGKKMIFTRNNYHKGKFNTAEDGTNHLQLYMASHDPDKGWEDLQPLPFNDAEFSTGHPAISADGRTLYFASNRPGGMGGTDIWKVRYSQGTWSDPENLGRPINTEGEEMFPSIAPDGSLFFASDGHGGLGGLDLFITYPQGKAWTEPQNPGYPLNSSRDDFGITFLPDGLKGFFSSNRDKKGRGHDDDIYAFSFKAPLPEDLLVEVRDSSTNQPIPGAQLSIAAGQEQKTEQRSNSKGQSTFRITPGQDYTLAAVAESFLPASQTVSVSRPASTEPLIIYLQPESLRLKLKVIDASNSEIIAEAITLLTQESDDVNMGKKTDSTGSVYFDLDPSLAYQLEVHKEGYFTDKSSLSDFSQRSGTMQITILLEPIIIGKAIEIENIYYDVNKADIRADAALELDKLVTFLLDNPSIRIELSSHTDSRGSDAYNLSLSQRRAQSAVNYIIQHGIDKKRIYAKGYGESQLLNECKNGVPCTAEQHQKNRRTEIKVVEIVE